jgi:hypothetical protein
MHMVWKSRGRFSEVFAEFWEGGYKGVVKIFGGGSTFLVFYCIFINKFCKILEGGYTFIPPPIPSPLPCAPTPSDKINRIFKTVTFCNVFQMWLKMSLDKKGLITFTVITLSRAHTVDCITKLNCNYLCWSHVHVSSA